MLNLYLCINVLILLSIRAILVYCNNNNNSNNYDLDYLLGQVKKELEFKQANLSQQSECKVTFSIDPIAEEFYLELIKDKKLHDKYNFQYDSRQFVNELLLLEYFRISKCRIINNHSSKIEHHILSITKDEHRNKITMIPHYYIIFIPFKYLFSINKTVTDDQKKKLKAILGINIFQKTLF